jgi:fructokinase
MEDFKAICYGELLWDVLPSGAMPGGAPMNVAYHLQKFGMQALPISRIGKDKWGDNLIALLNRQSINTQYIQIDEQYPTGIVNAFLKENNEIEYDIVYPVAWDFISLQKNLIPLVEKAPYFVFGSLASRNDISKNTLLQLLEAANIKVLDINLRPPHFNKTVLEILLHRADILKLNDHEVKIIAGWLNDYNTITEQANSIQEHFQIETILITEGANGALINDKGSFYKHEGYKVKTQDTIGSGDAFLAGYLFQLDNNSTPEQALQFANALGAFIATQPGACPEYSKQQVYKMMQG